MEFDQKTNKVLETLKKHAKKTQKRLQETPLNPIAVDGEQPISGYCIIDKVGSGGMGTVFKAQNVDTGELVAIKMLYPGHNNDPTILQQFINEGMMLINLKHPNILKGLDFGISKGFYFLAIELVEGESLISFIEKGFSFTEEHALRVALQVARALVYLEKRDIVHRDIKPANILLLGEKVKLCDLALAVETKNLEETESTCGTVEYISPEQAQGEKTLDSRSDVYSLGITCIHMISGKLPFEGDSGEEVMRRHIYEPINLNALGSFSPEVRKLLFGMTEKKQQDRLTATKVKEEIKTILRKRK
ncbi:serine/threonine protein kinase [Candidatus Uabimicrobium amorphum]|uniref:Serine/threonine protein kinase n=1 Tax=Uabimicrobium amorphum TaxID=2596890 RepID=A0A5S9IM42_UABAM|nr:serine/threonine-protein kinase [Candidatus Uabimicrobium amorphum]BBM83861.1 serine/threonine protein kinase [Candidatus Uabimicrobium amorphum]